MTDLVTIQPGDIPSANSIPAEAKTLIFTDDGPFQAVPYAALLAKVIKSDLVVADYATLAADLDHDEDTVALVINDPDPLLSGWYRKVDDAGDGEWIQFEKLSVAVLAAVLAAKIAAEAARDLAETHKQAAEDARDAAQAFAEFMEAVFAGGNIFKTKALLDAGIATFPNGEFALVLADETHSGHPAVYEKTAGAAVFVLDLSAAIAMSDVTGLVAALAAKAPLASPALTGTPTAPTAAPGTSTTQLATTAFVIAVRDALLNAAPGQLDTLKEFADALGNDANFAATITAALALKAPLASPALTGDIYLNGRQRSAAPVTPAALDIDCSSGTNYFTKQVNGNVTFTISNVPAGVFGFILEIDHVSGTITMPASVIPENGTFPSLTTGKKHLFGLLTRDGGTTWRLRAGRNYAS